MTETIPEDVARFLARKRQWHRRQALLPLPDKIRILLALQRQELPLLARQRPLRSWERPWDVTP